ncbi:hypothetical protein BCR37DRAFT_316763 [Protomyces lactucae-debilis]|uniref:CCHC-type domain-containing protein n=1 Tax=Protomyces lactucae-debilis TaxID=2754530 RepID=A0A1Y2FIF1_PROLT|nr:uncharacterized protein BCR37DRAFT_316763 [Protomyces lactucae-debilis]ORY82595.1 hypothetical protein BCR37DRAFT_316763 [Protomyces lactucae-debilis]
MSTIQCTIPQFSAGGLEDLQEALSPYGTMVSHHREYYPGLPHPTGKFSFLLSLHAEDKLPPKKMVVNRDNGYFFEEITINITPIPGKKLCYMCHKIGHWREACPVAPLCSSCGQTTAHGPKRCPLKMGRAPVAQKTKPRSGGPKPQVPVSTSATTQQSP